MTSTLERLESLLPQLPSAVERRHLGESLRKLIEAIEDSPRQIQRLAAILEIAQETGFRSDVNQAATLKDLIESGREAADMMLMAETPEHLRSVQDSYKEFIFALMNLDRQLRPHWRRIVEQDFAPLSAVGSLLEKIGNASDLGKRLAKCGRQAQEMSDKLSAVEFRDAIVRLLREKTLLEAERTSLTNDSEVDQFLNALAEGNATLLLVTLRVQDWLEKNGALDRFSITARS